MILPRLNNHVTPNNRTIIARCILGHIRQNFVLTNNSTIQTQRKLKFSFKKTYRKTSHISRTLVGNKIVDNSDEVGASPVGAAPTTSSLST